MDTVIYKDHIACCIKYFRGAIGLSRRIIDAFASTHLSIALIYLSFYWSVACNQIKY